MDVDIVWCHSNDSLDDVCVVYSNNVAACLVGSKDML